MKFTLNRDYVLVTKDGPSYGFKKGVPLHVPKHHAELAVGIGAEAADEDKQDAQEAVATAKATVDANTELRDMVVNVVRAIQKRNDAKDFTAGGTPKLQVVSAACGAEVDKAMLNEALVKLRLETALSE